MADILIKNMKIPKSCDGCFACEEFSYECYDYCNILKAPTTRGERRMDCPLVALPEHGRLGELDKIAERFHGFYEKHLENGNYETAEIWKYAEQEVRLQGTIVEATE